MELGINVATTVNPKRGCIGNVIRDKLEAYYAIMDWFEEDKTLDTIINDTDLNYRLGGQFVAVKKYTTSGK